jgi:hypothetical protein
MTKTRKTMALAGIGVAAAMALGVGGATLANAVSEGPASTATPTTGSAGPSQGPTQGSTSGSSGTLPGGGVPGRSGQGGAPDGMPGGRPGGPRDDGGKLTADAAAKAVTAAQAKVSGGTASSVRATSTGTYVVDVLKSDGTEVHVLLDATFAVTSVEEGGTGGRGGPGGAPPAGTSTGSSDSSDANGTSSSTT